MSRGLLARNPVGKSLYSVVAATVGTHITSSAWVEIEDSLPAPCDALEILNTTGALLKVAIGAAASEVETPFYIMPGSEPHIIPYNIAKGSRISVKVAGSVDATQDGDIAINWFG